jgi:hypothetical protein
MNWLRCSAIWGKSVRLIPACADALYRRTRPWLSQPEGDQQAITTIGENCTQYLLSFVPPLKAKPITDPGTGGFRPDAQVRSRPATGCRRVVWRRATEERAAAAT